MDAGQSLQVPPELAGQTLAATVRRLLGEISWSEVKRLIAGRRVKVNGTLSIDETRRMRADEVVTITGSSAPPPPQASAVSIVYFDEHLVIVDKPPGIQTVRRPEERGFSEEKKRAQPTLDEVLASMLASRPGRHRPHEAPAGRPRGGRPAVKLRAVHRLDRDTSGLMVFALSPAAEAELIKQFAAHAVRRVYTAVAHGRIDRPRTVESWIVRDRGDGLRGSLPSGTTNESAQRAVTHFKPLEHRGDRYTVVECRLETGRTHQIRIHLSELGHRLCGEQLYTRPASGGAPAIDGSGAPRQALHSGDLELVHPVTTESLKFKSPLPRDLATWLAGLTSL